MNIYAEIEQKLIQINRLERLYPRKTRPYEIEGVLVVLRRALKV